MPQRFSDQRPTADPRRRTGRELRRSLHVRVPEPVIFTHVKAPATGPGSAVRRRARAVRQGVPHHQRSHELALLNQEHGLVWQTHPRTKGSTGYPDAVQDKDFFQSDRFLGGSFQSLPVDLSRAAACAKPAASACWTT